MTTFTILLQNEYHIVYRNTMTETHLSVEARFQKIWNVNTCNFSVLSCKNERERECVLPFHIWIILNRVTDCCSPEWENIEPYGCEIFRTEINVLYLYQSVSTVEFFSDAQKTTYFLRENIFSLWASMGGGRGGSIKLERLWELL